MNLPTKEIEELRKEFVDKFYNYDDEGDFNGFSAFADGEPLIDWWLSKFETLITTAIAKEREEIVSKMESFMKDEFGYKGKYIEHDLSKKNHGTCCYCSTCGHDNDSCVCENNRIYNLLKSISLLSPNQPQV